MSVNKRCTTQEKGTTWGAGRHRNGDARSRAVNAAGQELKQFTGHVARQAAAFGLVLPALQEGAEVGLHHLVERGALRLPRGIAGRCTPGGVRQCLGWLHHRASAPAPQRLRRISPAVPPGASASRPPGAQQHVWIRAADTFRLRLAPPPVYERLWNACSAPQVNRWSCANLFQR